MGKKKILSILLFSTLFANSILFAVETKMMSSQSNNLKSKYGYGFLILDFFSLGNVDVITKDDGGAIFDLDDNGTEEKTGWVSGDHAAILVLDLDENKNIEGGRELFGTRSKNSRGVRFLNGYYALKQYDKDGDNAITINDPIYSTLLLWFDKKNYEGIYGTVEKGELRTLYDEGVIKIGLKNIRTGVVQKNKTFLKLKSKFWGPDQCGVDGCDSYLLYFHLSN